MILLSTTTSPFGRKVKIAALAHGLSDRITIQKGDPWSEDDILLRTNPLGKMPALILDDGKAIYDSGVILDYLDTLLDRPRIFPAERRLQTQVFHALGSGLIDAALLMTYERMRRPAEFTYEPWIAHLRQKLERGLTSLVANGPDPRVADAGSIALACALGYFDWRKPIDWRNDYPALVDWLDAFREAVPAFDATKAER